MVLTPGAARALAWPDVAERVESGLASMDPGKRRAAAKDLGTLGLERATPLALRALADDDVEVRLAAAKQAIALRMIAATEETLPWLSDRDARLRVAACEVSFAMPNPAVTVAPLSRALGDSDPQVRAACASALGAQGSAAAVGPLSGKLDDPAPAVRSEVTRALAKIRDPRAVVPLVSKVQDAAPDVRRDVVRALGELGDARATQALLLALRDNVTEVKVEAFAALGRMRAQEAVAAIAPDTLERNAGVRQAALVALGRIATEDAVRALVKGLGTQEDANGSLERTAVRDALVTAAHAGAMRDVLVAMTSLIDKPGSSAVATSAAWILGELRATSSAQAIVSALRKGTLAPEAAMHALAGAGTAAEVPTVLEFVADPHPRVREEAIRAATALLDPAKPDGRAVEPLVATLRSARTSSEERAAVATLLGRTGAPRAATELASLVSAKDSALRLAAIDALGALGSAVPNHGVADDALAPLLDDRDPVIRLHAATALAASGGKKAESALLAKLDGGGEIDRYAVLTALAGIADRLPSEGTTTRLFHELANAAGPERDAVLEAAGRARLPAALRGLAAVAKSDDVDDRRMVATLLGGHRGSAAAIALLDKLASDPDERVRQEAVFALGSIGDRASVARLASIMKTSDTAVAANAVAGIAKIAAVLGPSQASFIASVVCPMLANGSSVVRTNALVALANAGARCEGNVAGKKEMEAPSKVRKAVTIFIFDDAGAVARPRAPYLLEYQDGMLRVGITDRRGAAFDPAAPAGTVTLRRMPGR